MTIEEAKIFIKNQAWTFAKTMPEMPHEYIKKNLFILKEFNEFVNLIREEGYIKKFNGREYTYLDIDNYTYWTMGAPINQTIIINRAKLW